MHLEINTKDKEQTLVLLCILPGPRVSLWMCLDVGGCLVLAARGRNGQTSSLLSYGSVGPLFLFT